MTLFLHVCVKWSICSGQAPCWPGGNYKGSGPGESAESSTLVALFSHSCPSLYNYTWSGKLSHISFRNLIRELVDISRLIISPNYVSLHTCNYLYLLLHTRIPITIQIPEYLIIIHKSNKLYCILRYFEMFGHGSFTMGSIIKAVTAFFSTQFDYDQVYCSRSMVWLVRPRFES